MIASTTTTPARCALRAVSVYLGSVRRIASGALTSPPTRSGPSSFGSGGGAGAASVVPVPPTVPPTTPPGTPPSCPPTTPPTTPPATPPATPPGTPPGSPPDAVGAGVVSTIAPVAGISTFGNSVGISCGCTNEGSTFTGWSTGVDFGALEGAGGGGGGGGGGGAPAARNACIGLSSASTLCVADAPMKTMKATIAPWMPSDARRHFQRLSPFCLLHSMSWLLRSIMKIICNQ